MASVTPDAAAIKRTFANVAASASSPALPNGTAAHKSNNDEAMNVLEASTANGSKAQNPPTSDVTRINPAIPMKLAQSIPRPPRTPNEPAQSGSKSQAQDARASHDEALPLGSLPPSAISDETSTQLSSSGSSAKPASLDGKSVASATTFAMDEKESLRPDDSASVKAIEDEELYSPPETAAAGSRIDSETGARAFRDQLQEITSMGPPSLPTIPAVDARATSKGGLLYDPSVPSPAGQPPSFTQATQAMLGKPADFPPDPKLLEALSNPRDRIWVLKLEQDIIDFVKDSKEAFVDLPQCNSFYRMLAHKLADYYLLGHAVDNTVTAVRLYRTPTCRIAPPLTALTTPSTASNTPPPSAPQVKILRRGGEAPMANTNSEAGDSDSEKNKAPLTREEREQRYEQARLRIMGSAKPEVEPAVPKEKDDSRSSSVTGKKKPRKQRTDSEDGFDPRSAYSSYPPGSSFAHSGVPDNGAAAGYYPVYSDSSSNNGPVYGTTNGYAPQTYNAVYGQTMPPQASYPWLQQGYGNAPDAGFQHWDQAQQNGNDLAVEFQQMSFHSPQQQGRPHTGPYNSQQQSPAWPQGMPYQQSFPTPPGAQQYGPSDRPASSASYNGPYGYGPSPNQYMGPNNAAMNGAFSRGSFNPQSQAFIPGYPGQSGPMNFMPGMGPSPNGYNAYGHPQPLQRQGSTNSQASSYSGQRSSNDTGASTGMTHALPQPVFSPNVPMPYQGQKWQPSMPSRAGTQSGANERSPGGGNGSSASTIAKWGTPASLPAKPPPPAKDSFDVSRIQDQRGTGRFNPAAAARMASMGSPGYHALPNMAGMRGAPAGQTPRSG
ncbi:hypothetical protein AAFC00_002572 [Neodothiora populina]|uniref:R3H domain-containing protein 2 n=1 Tax=Neodothiora populina TaxID=2781224 RepID=A0ABR3P892_9PEZI